tara:strand:+ start:911 stop:1630 length:720 start_codon:yes stop_codon:yes gene_type:complete
MSIDYYSYELKKSRVLGGFLGNKVAIRQEWVKRTRRYVVAQGLDLNALATFVKKGLYDRRVETFNEKALAEPLSKAQQWTLMWLILQEFGVPEWLQDPEKDENVPEMSIPEPEDEPESVVNALMTPATSVASSAANTATTVTGAAVSATADAGKAGLGATKAVGSAALAVAAVPVKTLSSLVNSSAKDEAEEAIADAEEAIAQAENAETANEESSETPDTAEEVQTEAPNDAEVVQSGE